LDGDFGSEDGADGLAALGGVLLTEAQDSADPAMLDVAILVLEQALAGTFADHPDRAGRLSNLGLALRLRAYRTGSRADLDRAAAGRAAVSAVLAGDPDSPAYLATYADTMQSRFELWGELADLDEAIGSHQQAVAAGRSHPARPLLETNLGAALLNRSLTTGSRDDLDLACAACRRAASAAAADGAYYYAVAKPTWEMRWRRVPATPVLLSTSTRPSPPAGRRSARRR
jgi:hypothetical protein